jgi:hypothetical protein
VNRKGLSGGRASWICLGSVCWTRTPAHQPWSLEPRPRTLPLRRAGGEGVTSGHLQAQRRSGPRKQPKTSVASRAGSRGRESADPRTPTARSPSARVGRTQTLRSGPRVPPWRRRERAEALARVFGWVRSLLGFVDGDRDAADRQSDRAGEVTGIEPGIGPGRAGLEVELRAGGRAASENSWLGQLHRSTRNLRRCCMRWPSTAASCCGQGRRRGCFGGCPR